MPPKVSYLENGDIDPICEWTMEKLLKEIQFKTKLRDNQAKIRDIKISKKTGKNGTQQ
jgi:hypothetical protein